MYSGQLQRGDAYPKLCRCIVVFILSYRELRAERFHSIFRVQEVHDHEPLSDQLEIHFVELPKLGADAGENRERTLVNWGKFLTATTDREREQLATADPIFQQAKTALERLSADPEARQLAEQREIALQASRLDFGKVFWQGKAEGLREGLLKLLPLKFGPLPLPAQARIQSASEHELERLMTRALVVNTLDEVLAD
jgi:predicted transposase/invertase (TIGR01784 family)